MRPGGPVPTAGPGTARTAHRDVTERLREAILTGALQTGTHLVQTELAAGLEVSVTPVREALRELESQGLVDSDPFRGAAVHRISLEELTELHELRRLLVPPAVRERVTTITDTEIAQARALLGRMSGDAGESDDRLTEISWVDGERALHRLLEGTSHRRNLRAILRRLSDVAELYAGLCGLGDADRHRAQAEYRSLIGAYAQRDAATAIEVTLRQLDETARLAQRALSPGSRGNPPSASR